MLNLNYYIHVLLQSKYKIFINLFLLIIIYSLFYSQQFVHCMTEGDVENITSQIAEAKPTRPHLSHVEQVIHNQVTSYLDTVSIIEAKDQTIASLEAENKQLKTDLRVLAKNYIRVDCDRLKEQGLLTLVERMESTDPFFREDDSLIDELKQKHPYIFEEGGFNLDNEGSGEQERGAPDLLFYGKVPPSKKDGCDY